MNQDTDGINIQNIADDNAFSSVPSETLTRITSKWKFAFIGLALVIFVFYLIYFLNKTPVVISGPNHFQPTLMPTTYQSDPSSSRYLATVLSDICASQEESKDLSNTPFKTSKAVSSVSCDLRDGSLHIAFKEEPVGIGLHYTDLDPVKKKLSLSHNLSNNPDTLIYLDIYGSQEPCEPELGIGVELRLIGIKTLTSPSGETVTVSASKKIVEPSDTRLISFLTPYAKETQCVDSNTYQGIDMSLAYPEGGSRSIDYDKLQNDFAEVYQRKFKDRNSIEELEDVLDGISLDSNLLPK